MIIWVMKIFSSVYSRHLFLISSASVRSILFLSFIEPIFAGNVPLVSHFLEEISSLSHSVVSLYFFALIAEEGFSYLFLLFFGTLHSNAYIFPFLLCCSLLFFSQLFVRPFLHCSGEHNGLNSSGNVKLRGPLKGIPRDRTPSPPPLVCRRALAA